MSSDLTDQQPQLHGEGAPEEILDYPAARTDPLHPPPTLIDRQGGPAATPVRLWDGSRVWLVTGYEHARALLTDTRLTAVTSAPGFPMMTRTSTVVRAQPRSASFIRMDNPEHGTLRSMLRRDFLPRAAEEHRPGVRRIVDSLLAPVLVADQQPVDLVATLAAPAPARVIADLLAIPAADLDFFVGRSAVLIDRSYGPEQVTAAREELDSYLGELARARLDQPGDDLVSRLMAAHVATGELALADAVPMIRLLLVAGHGTTASQAALSLLSVASDPALRDLCVAEPDVVPGLVDEMLRFHTIVQNGLTRAAVADIDLDGVRIRAGEGVVISLSAANRDPQLAGDPDVIDARRDARRHLAFGHGIHQCLGKWLAKVELEEILLGVLHAMPQVALAVPLDQVEFCAEVSSYGVDALPVTW